ncbi:MAG: hypothetical protein K8L99_25035 [Anaerolineae bacterium]|nr:hypothetical protein [Anaerolineae bacterium]
MTRKIYKRLLEKKAVLKQLLKGNTLEKQHALVERMRTINRKLDVFHSYNNLMAESVCRPNVLNNARPRPLGRSVFAGKGANHEHL